jgi:hypothetical protein
MAQAIVRAKPLNVYPPTFTNLDHSTHTACEDGTECSETPAFKTQTPGNYPKEIIQQGQFSSLFFTTLHVYASTEENFGVSHSTGIERFYE